MRTRRVLLTRGGAALGAAAAGLFGASGRAVARAAARAIEACAPTPRQVRGPFYPAQGISGVLTDLTRRTPGGPLATGTILYVSGRVLDLTCRPVEAVEVQLWQADTNGRYDHPRDSSPGPRDPNFRYSGEAVTDAEGRYAFKTIVPAPYTGRTAHIHFAIRAKGRPELVTQMYFAGHPRNAEDFLLNELPEEERARLLVALGPAPAAAEPGARRGTFDITLS